MRRPNRTATRAAALACAALSTAAIATAAAGPADAASTPYCTGSQLVEGYRYNSGATGHGGLTLEFRNRGTSACDLRGWPGFDVLRRNGSVLAHAERTYMGFMGGSRNRTEPTVHVRPGHYASAIVEWENINRSGACRTGASFAFTPPGTTKTEHRTGRIPICSLEVHPTAYGRAGQHG